MKIILGTANFGQKYGINNKKVTKSQIKQILSVSKKNKIKQIDTAIDYGNTETILGDIGVDYLKICTKLPNIPKNLKKKQIEKWIFDQVQRSLKNLKVAKLHAILLHSTIQLDSYRGRVAFHTLKKLKEKGIVKLVGYSIYSTSELNKFFNKFKPDIIELPYNILDRRSKTNGWLLKLKKSKVEVWARSIFLQGLLLLPKTKRPVFFKRWNKLWNVWDSYCRISDPLEICLKFALKEKLISKLVIGVNNKDQLSEIISIIKNNNNSINEIIRNIIKKIKTNDKKLLEPFRWKKI